MATQPEQFKIHRYFFKQKLHDSIYIYNKNLQMYKNNRVDDLLNYISNLYIYIYIYYIQKHTSILTMQYVCYIDSLNMM